MKIRQSVFGSRSERFLYKALKTRWGKRFNLFPSLPFPNIIDIEAGEVTEKEWQFLLKTSVDFTLCEKEGDKPLLSIEFDGLGHGFSRKGKYIQFVPTEDAYRKLKLDLKLRIAWEVGYPFFVVSYEESLPFGWEMDLTIVDGIIGRVLARRHFLEVMNEMSQEELEEHIKILASIYPEGSRDRDGYIQDIVVGEEVQAELLWDPIAKEASKLQEQLLQRHVIKSWSYRFVEEPPVPIPPDFFDTEALKKRIEAINYAVRVGCVYSIATSFGEVEKTAWVRNIEGFGVSPLTISENIAELLALKEVEKRSQDDSVV